MASELERRVMARVGELEVRLASLQSQQQGSQEVVTLQWQVAQLRDALARVAAAQEAVYPSDGRIARGTPVYLPPVNDRR